MRRALLLAAAVATAASPAVPYEAINRLQVVPAGGQDFTVQFRPLAGLADYWCAAGDYAQRGLRLDSRTRVYRRSPEPRKRGQGITFTLDPARSVGYTGLTTFGGPQDGSFSAGTASAQFCHTFDIVPFPFE